MLLVRREFVGLVNSEDADVGDRRKCTFLRGVRDDPPALLELPPCLPLLDDVRRDDIVK